MTVYFFAVKNHDFAKSENIACLICVPIPLFGLYQAQLDSCLCQLTTTVCQIVNVIKNINAIALSLFLTQNGQWPGRVSSGLWLHLYRSPQYGGDPGLVVRRHSSMLQTQGNKIITYINGISGCHRLKRLCVSLHLRQSQNLGPSRQARKNTYFLELYREVPRSCDCICDQRGSLIEYFQWSNLIWIALQFQTLFSCMWAGYIFI